RLQLPGLSVPYLHVYSSLHCLCETVFCFTGKKYIHPLGKSQSADCTKAKPREPLALSVLYSLLESGLLVPVCFPDRLASLVGDPTVQSHSEMGAQGLEHLDHDHQNHH